IFFVSLKLGGIPIQQMMAGRIDVADYNNLLKGVPFGVMSLINVFSMLFLLQVSTLVRFYRKLKKIWRAQSLVLFTFVPFLCFWQGKRQLFLFFILVILFRFNQKVSLKSFLKIMAFGTIG